LSDFRGRFLFLFLFLLFWGRFWGNGISLPQLEALGNTGYGHAWRLAEAFDKQASKSLRQQKVLHGGGPFVERRNKQTNKQSREKL
jgi:hypothetical protein